MEERHLTPLDATFLELEEGDESAHMHVGWAMIFEPLPEGGTPSLGAVRELLAERLELLPLFLCRLSSRHTGRLSWPSWEPDPERTGSTAVTRSGRRPCSTGSRTVAGRSRPRSTTASSMGSAAPR